MCAGNLVFFLGLITVDALLFGVVGTYIESLWIWGWNLGTVYLGWQLAKQRFRQQREQNGFTFKVDRSFRTPFLLMLPGLVSDTLALSAIVSAYVRNRRYQQRRRSSSLWVGQPDAKGVIQVEAVRVSQQQRPKP